MRDAFTDPTWRIATNGIRPGYYGIARFAGREWAEGESGRIRWFKSPAAAQRVADGLNGIAAT